MKSILKIAACFAALSLAFCACDPAPTPDGAVLFYSFSIPKALNSSLPSDIIGVIEGETISLVIPAENATESLIPSFKASEYDVVTISGQVIESEVTSVKFTDGMKINLSDEVSAMDKSYTVSVSYNDGAAELKSIAFKASENDTITEDIAPESIESNMLVRVPGQAFQKPLILSLTAGDNDVIKVNNEVVSGSSVKVDTSFPIDITVTDEIAGAKSEYVLKVGKILERVWTKAGTYSNAGLDSYCNLAVDAKNDVPYIVLEQDKTADDGTTIDNMSTVVKYNGAALEIVGKEGFTDGKSSYAAIDALDGKVYVFYADATAPSTSPLSAMKFDGSSWSYIGSKGFGLKYNTQTYYPLAICVEPKTGKIVTAFSTNAANSATGLARRDLAINEWTGSAWESGKPVPGRSSGYSYSPRLIRTADAIYLLIINQQAKTHSMYKYVSGTWSPVFEGFGAEGISTVGLVQISLTADSKGNLYFALNEDATGKYLCQVYKVNNGKPEKFGNTIPNATFGNKYNQFALTIDVNDNPAVAYIPELLSGETDYKAYIATVNPDTKAWDTYKLCDKCNHTNLAAGRADNGNMYVTFTCPLEKGNEVNLYKYSLEKDIIPE